MAVQTDLIVGKCLIITFFQCLQGAGQDKLGIYVKSVVKGGAADIVSRFCSFLFLLTRTDYICCP